MRLTPAPALPRSPLLAVLLACTACPPASLDPVVTDGTQTGDTTTEAMSSGLSVSGTDGQDSAAPTTGSTTDAGATTESAQSESTGAAGSSTGDASTTGSDGPSTGAADDTSSAGSTGANDSTSDSTGAGDSTGDSTGTGDTTGGGSLLDPCPVDQPIFVEVSGNSPVGPFTAVTGVFHWETGPDLYLEIDFLAEAPALPWDFDLNAVANLSVFIVGFEGMAPEFWLGDRIAGFNHFDGMDSVNIERPITITEDTLELWSLNWDDYETAPVLGGNFEFVGDGWNLAGEFIVPYCNPMSELHPI